MPGIAWKRWNWLEWLLIPVVSAVMHTTWIAALNQRLLDSILITPSGVVFPAWLVLGLLLGASLLEHLSPEGLRGRLIVALTGVLVLLAVLGWRFQFDATAPDAWIWQLIVSLTKFNEGIPATLWITLVTALLWRQGMVIRWNDYSTFWRSFVAGIVVFAILALWPGRAATEGADLGLWSAIGLFLLCGLVGLALLSVTETLAYERSRGAKTPAVNRYWLAALGTVVCLILIGGWLLGQFLSPETVAHILKGLGAVLNALLRLIELILTPIIMLIFWLLEPIIDFLRRQVRQPQEIGEFGEGLMQEWQQEEEAITGAPEELLNVLRIIFAVALLAGILFLLIRSWRYRRVVPAGGLLEEREYIWSKDLLMEQLRQLWSRGKQRALSPYLPLDQPDDSRQAVRLLYQRLLARLREAGWPRSPGTTPLAYAHHVSALLSTEHKALHALTAAYHIARYGDAPPTPEQVADAQAALDRIVQALDQRGAPGNGG
jgi:hypothetical protein